MPSQYPLSNTQAGGPGASQAGGVDSPNCPATATYPPRLAGPEARPGSKVRVNPYPRRPACTPYRPPAPPPTSGGPLNRFPIRAQELRSASTRVSLTQATRGRPGSSPPNLSSGYNQAQKGFQDRFPRSQDGSTGPLPEGPRSSSPNPSQTRSTQASQEPGQDCPFQVRGLEPHWYSLNRA
jgi:hypothetical protein